MNLPGAPRPAAPRRWQARALVAAWALLAAWAVGIGVAAVQLDHWRQELSPLLLQLNADAQFRARARDRDAVDPEWYRRKALALLSATERLENDSAWSAFVPGSWRHFDQLEEQLQERIEREFAEIVVETLRRELHMHASRLTGVPLAPGSGELQVNADCKSPLSASVDRKLTGAAEDLPEFRAVADYVAAVERLDGAVQSFFSLQYAGGRPEQLRALVAYTLGKELPGPLAGAVRMFEAGDEVNIQPALMQARLQWAARCSLAKAMTALHARLLSTNDLFALEQGLVERSAGLFEPGARPASFDRTLERYRAVRALLDDQEALLAKGRNDWMRQGTLQLGPAYQDLLRRMERNRLLGPPVVQQLLGQSGAAFAEFRHQFQLAFGSRSEPGVVWLPGEGRFGLSADRAALRKGLAALLQASFMAEEAPRAAKGTKVAKAVKSEPDAGTLAQAVQEAQALAAERARAVSDIVPLFPRQAQPVVTRVVDARVSELIYQRAYRALRAALPGDSPAPLDPAAFGRQRQQVLALQSLLRRTGGTALGERLVAALDAELLRRLGPMQEEWRRLPLQDLRLADFSWWQGEPLPLAQALGATEPGVPPSFHRTAARLDALVQQVRRLLALGSPGIEAEPAAAPWLQLQAELQRYHARASDSSLRRLEQYVAALGPDLRRENCTERLAAHAPAGLSHDDEIALRHVQLHGALVSRCEELRAQALVAAPSLVVQ